MLLLLITTALGSDAVTTGEFTDRLRTLARVNSGGVVLVPIDESSEKALAAAATSGAIPAFPRRVARETSAKTAAEQGAASANVRCALVVSTPVAAMWKVEAFGDCGGVFPAETLTFVSATGAAAPISESNGSESLISELAAMSSGSARKARLATELGATTDPDRAAALGQALAVVGQLDLYKRTDPSIVKLFLRAALSPDPSVRAAAVAAAAANTDPPSLDPVPAPNAASPALSSAQSALSGTGTAAPDAEKLRAYRQKHLVRGPLQFTSGGGGNRHYVAPVTTVVTWGVNDGGGAPFTSRTFAERIGDPATISKLEDETRRSRGLATGLWVATGALTVVSIAAFAGGPEYPGLDSCSSGDDDYDACEEHADAVMAEYQAASTTSNVVGAMAILGATTTFTFALVVPIGRNLRQQFVANYYTVEEADRWIETHNAQVRTELGLSQDDVKTIDLQSRTFPTFQLSVAAAPTFFGVTGTF